MARPGDFVDPDYDKRLAEFKARRDAAKREMAASKGSVPEKRQEPSVNRSPVQQSRQEPSRNTSSFARRL